MAIIEKNAQYTQRYTGNGESMIKAFSEGCDPTPWNEEIALPKLNQPTSP
jgi:hypothetical protein